MEQPASVSTTANTQFETIVGLEVHAQLLTQSKAFATASTEFGSPPNTQVTPLCLGHPGTLPVPNENLIRYTIKLGLATECDIAERSIFARKNYFYPDLPKGYQISQYETPICYDGEVEIEPEGAEPKRVGITRIHMEEDAGKSIHDQDPHNSLIDLNRAGVPLIEIVSEPDIRSPQEAYAYLTKIKQLVQYLDICDGNMEEGSLRCDANVSVRPKGQEKFGTRTEIKNLNSFRNVERALTYEVERQKELIRNGRQVVQQTLLWDADKLQTRQMRSKEEAHDYRYFPEPDIPPIVVTEETLSEVRAELPELPQKRYERFTQQLKLPEFDAKVITAERFLADYFEEVLEHVDAKSKQVSNLIITEVRRVLNEQSIDIREFSIGAEQLAGLITLRESDKISSTAMQTIFNKMLESDTDAETLASELNLLQVSDSGFLEPIVDEVIQANPEEVERYRSGKKGLLGFFVGQVMQKSQGKANPQMVKDLITSRLEE